MPRFEIIYGERNQPKETWTGKHVVNQFDEVSFRNRRIVEWNDPKEAAALVKRLNAAMRDGGHTRIYMLNKLPEPVDYLAREAAREDYLPFEVQGEAYHCAELKGAEVSFYTKLDDAYSDRRTTMKLGRYLRQFTVKNDNEIADICARNGVECNDRMLHFARTREEIKKVYASGPRSCMSGDSFGSVHPAEAYASPDISVAYIADPDNENRITARAVCNEMTKEFNSIYGDHARLRPMLEAAGYKKHEKYHYLQGCRLLKIDIGKGYACPYIDSDDSVGPHPDDENYMLVMSDGGAYTSEYGYISYDYDGIDDDDYEEEYDNDYYY